MERMENESFEDYKARRAESNKARDQINAKTKHQGGLQSSRQILRDRMRAAGKLRPSYGAGVIAAAAQKRIADGTLQEKHAKYMLAQIAKKHGTGRNVEERKAA